MGIGHTDLKCPVCGKNKMADMDGVMECMACGSNERFDKTYSNILGWFIPIKQFKKIFTGKKKPAKRLDFVPLSLIKDVEGLPIWDWKKRYPHFHDWILHNGFRYYPKMDKTLKVKK